MATAVAAVPEIMDPGRAGGGPPVLDRMCASDEPLLAAIANCIAGYIRERDGDVAGAVEATEAMRAVPDGSGSPWLRLVAHSRLSELLMQLDQGERALYHLRASLDLLETHRWPDMFGLLWAIAAAHSQLGEFDEAERWLDKALVDGPAESYGTATYNLGARAEIAFGRGDIETGLRLWRQAAQRLTDDENPVSEPASDPWTLETHCVTVVAHARHGRLDLVEDIVAGLPAKLEVLLKERTLLMPSFFMDLPVCGGLLLAMAMVDLARDDASPDARTWAVRAIALAGRLHHLRAFQPTMSSAAARRAAEDADGPAYSDAVSEYAGLGREELRDAARALARARLSGAPSG
jgi:tetratricopeptide (TPR) repeat protein